MSDNPHKHETGGCHSSCMACMWDEGARSRDDEVSAKAEEIDALKAKLCILAAEVDADRAEKAELQRRLGVDSRIRLDCGQHEGCEIWWNGKGKPDLSKCPFPRCSNSTPLRYQVIDKEKR